MNTPRVRFRSTAYHNVLASEPPWIRCHGGGATPSGEAMRAPISWFWVAI